MEKNVSKFNENSIKNFDEEIDKGCIVKAHVEYPKKLQTLHNHFYQEE